MRLLNKFMGNKNAKAGMFYFVGNLFNRAIAFITIPIFTRMLSTSEYGIYTTYDSWVSILAVIVGLSLGNTIRNAYVDYKEKLDEYISSITVLSLLFLVLVLALGMIGGKYTGISSVLIFFCIIQAYMSNLVSCYAIKYMMEVNYVMRLVLLALPNCLGMVLSIPVIYLMTAQRHMGRIYVQLAVYVVIGCIVLIGILIKGKFAVKPAYWKYAISLAIPMVFHGLSVNLLANSDRTMITLYRGESETGIYGLIYSLSMIASAIISALENVWIPWFTDRMVEKNYENINARVKDYIAFNVLLLFGFMMVSPEVLVIMADEPYWAGKYLLGPLIAAYFFISMYSISVQVEYYYKQTKYIALNTLMAGLLNIILNLIFIPSYGMVAAAYTTLVSYIVSFVVHYFTAKKLDQNLFNVKMYIVPVVMILAGIGYTNYFMEQWYMRWAAAAIMCCVVGIGVFRKFSKN